MSQSTSEHDEWEQQVAFRQSEHDRITKELKRVARGLTRLRGSVPPMLGYERVLQHDIDTVLQAIYPLTGNNSSEDGV